MPFLVKVAWRNLLRQKRRTFITASAMAIGVGLCMAMIAFSDGFYTKFFDILVGQSLGHAQVHHPDYPGKRSLHDTLPDAEAMLGALDGVDDIEAASGRLFGFGLVGGKDETTGALFIGVDPARELDFGVIGDRVVTGSFLAPDATHQAVLGAGLAKDLGVAVGDSIVIMTQAADGSMGNDLYDVVGTVRTGATQTDKSGLYLHLADTQELLVLPDQVHEIVLVGPDPDLSAPLAEDARAALEALPGAADRPILLQTWYEADPNTAQMMEMQNVGALIMLGIVFSVAALGVLNTMLMAVFERTRELGLLKALGLTPSQIMRLVVIESVLLAGLSCVLGAALGGALDWYSVAYGIDLSVNGEGMTFQGVTLDPVVYGTVRPEGILMTLASVFTVCVLASLWPAFRAARLRPVESMRQV